MSLCGNKHVCGSSKTSDGSGTRRARVLIVEDEAVIALETSSNLIQWGYEVCGVAADSRDAVRQAESTRPDLALVDVNLRGGDDGVSVAQRLREICGVAVVFVTGSSDSRSRRRMAAVDPDGYLFKPYDPAALRSIVAGVLA